MQAAIEAIQHTWKQLHQRLGLDISEEVEDKWWDRLVQNYGYGGDNGRFYHNLAHVGALLDLCKAHEASLRRKDLVELAIFFHDVIYDAKAKDNEEESAKLFDQYASEVGLNVRDKETVFKWIIDTKTHTTADIKGDEDEAYFLDFDLSILGESDERYDEYASQIRQEYAHIPDDAYRNGRAQVLERFLQVPSLFRTEIFRNEREKKARANLCREIERLRNTEAL